MRVVALYRVSTGEQANSGLGIEAQEELVRKFIVQNGWELVGEHYERGVSGKLPLDQRPELCAAIAAATTFKADAFIVKAIDRLSRDPLVQLTIERTLMRAGVRVVSAAGEGTQDDAPANVFLRRIMAAQGELEASLTAARTRAALRAKRERGERLGRPPFGTKVFRGELVPAEGYEFVVRVLELRAIMSRKELPSGKKGKLLPMTYHRIAEHLEAETGESWSYAKVARIVKQWGDLSRLQSEVKQYEQ